MSLAGRDRVNSNYTLTVQEVSKRFDNFTAVDSLTLNVPAGTMYGLLGPNGAGKTTTLRMIMNITIPDSGHIEILDDPCRKNSRGISDISRRRGVSIPR
jgi:ABC-2 type transport system ATP-binding protein